MTEAERAVKLYRDMVDEGDKILKSLQSLLGQYKLIMAGMMARCELKKMEGQNEKK